MELNAAQRLSEMLEAEKASTCGEESSLAIPRCIKNVSLMFCDYVVHMSPVRPLARPSLLPARRRRHADALFPEYAVPRVLAEAGTETRIVDVQLTNGGAKDFNGKPVYLRQLLASGYLGKQYCVVKSASPSAAIHRFK